MQTVLFIIAVWILSVAALDKMLPHLSGKPLLSELRYWLYKGDFHVFCSFCVFFVGLAPVVAPFVFLAFLCMLFEKGMAWASQATFTRRQS